MELDKLIVVDKFVYCFNLSFHYFLLIEAEAYNVFLTYQNKPSHAYIRSAPNL